MAERKKLELQLNEPQILKILADPILGKNDYGPYYLFLVSNGKDEYSFFAPSEQIYQQLKTIGKGNSFELTKTARKNGKGIQVEYEIVSLNQEEKQTVSNAQKDNYFDLMLLSFEDALKIQSLHNGMANVNQIAITLFIQRTKGSHSFSGG
ncbi:MAG: hypothetical protein NTZ27_04480 [Ignavibacteriales bacterium]|nr:hypothetical protein [Ignavibacteriales bacterium]